MLVSPPVADSAGALPVAALVTENSFTADEVVANLICSLLFSSSILWASSIIILLSLVSRLPPS